MTEFNQSSLDSVYLGLRGIEAYLEGMIPELNSTVNEIKQKLDGLNEEFFNQIL